MFSLYTYTTIYKKKLYIFFENFRQLHLNVVILVQFYDILVRNGMFY